MSMQSLKKTGQQVLKLEHRNEALTDRQTGGWMPDGRTDGRTLKVCRVKHNTPPLFMWRGIKRHKKFGMPNADTFTKWCSTHRWWPHVYTSKYLKIKKKRKLEMCPKYTDASASCFESLTYIHNFRSMFVSHWTNLLSIIFIHQLAFEIWQNLWCPRYCPPAPPPSMNPWHESRRCWSHRGKASSKIWTCYHQ